MAERELQDARIKLTVDDADLRETMRRIEGENRKTEGRRAAGGRNSNTLNSMRGRAGSAVPAGLFTPVTALVPEMAPLVQAGVTGGAIAVAAGRKARERFPFVTGRGVVGREELAGAVAAGTKGKRKSLNQAAIAGAGLLALNFLVPAAIASGVTNPVIQDFQGWRLGAKRAGNVLATSFDAGGQTAAIMAASGFVGQDLDIDTSRGLFTDIQAADEAAADIKSSMDELRNAQAGRLIVQGTLAGGIELAVETFNKTKAATGEAGTAMQRKLSDWWSKIRMPGTGYR